MMLAPIPTLTEPDFAGISISESGEVLEQLTTEGRIYVSPAYAALGYRSASNTILLRSGAVAALKRAAAALPQGFTLVVWDGLRTLSMQDEIAVRFNQDLIAQELSEDQRVSMLHKYVAPLPTCREDFEATPPAHTTGGAVDLTLGDHAGNPLDLGAGFDEFSVYAAPDYYENVDNAISKYIDFRDLRRLLFWTMVDAGFSPYCFEFWHFEFGTKRAAGYWKSSSARYGAAVPWKQLGDKNDSATE